MCKIMTYTRCLFTPLHSLDLPAGTLAPILLTLPAVRGTILILSGQRQRRRPLPGQVRGICPSLARPAGRSYQRRIFIMELILGLSAMMTVFALVYLATVLLKEEN